MFKKIFLLSISCLILLIASTKQTFATSIPDFGSCLNPKGDLIVSYDSGTHGIVGQANATGSDAVYKSLSNGVTQCMCPDSGNGIQTNWLRADQMSDSDINIFKSEGWIYIATGSVWGLDDVSYIAKNSNYSCRNNAKVDNSQSILGLANTGDSKTIYEFVIAGAAFLISGLIFRKFSKK